MPQLQRQTKFRRGFKKWADETATRLRNELGLRDYSPLCAFKLCEHLNVPIWVPSEVEGLSLDFQKTLLGENSSTWSAATIPLKNGKYLIVHNPIHSPARQQSNLMHEVAHIMCHHEVPEEAKILGLSGFLRNHNPQDEEEAIWLGACLQLPRPSLLWALKKGMTQTQIADHYSASPEMVRFRINVTGVKKQISRLKNYSRW